jgi:hypothetical protein
MILLLLSWSACGDPDRYDVGTCDDAAAREPDGGITTCEPIEDPGPCASVDVCCNSTRCEYRTEDGVFPCDGLDCDEAAPLFVSCCEAG